jgi:hypothetical protein
LKIAFLFPFLPLFDHSLDWRSFYFHLSSSSECQCYFSIDLLVVAQFLACSSKTTLSLRKTAFVHKHNGKDTCSFRALVWQPFFLDVLMTFFFIIQPTFERR